MFPWSKSNTKHFYKSFVNADFLRVHVCMWMNGSGAHVRFCWSAFGDAHKTPSKGKTQSEKHKTATKEKWPWGSITCGVTAPEKTRILYIERLRRWIRCRLSNASYSKRGQKMFWHKQRVMNQLPSDRCLNNRCLWRALCTNSSRNIHSVICASSAKRLLSAQAPAHPAFIQRQKRLLFISSLLNEVQC